MSTQPQIEANRLNSLHSTGPRTEAGKETSSRNALKHGLTGKEFFVPPDEQADFDQLQSELEAEYAPQTAIARHLYTQILHASWKMHRADSLEAELLAANPTLSDESAARRLDLFARYRARAERSFYRARRELLDHTTNLLTQRSLPTLVQEAAPGPVKANEVHRAFRDRLATWWDRDKEDFNFPHFPERKRRPIRATYGA